MSFAIVVYFAWNRKEVMFIVTRYNVTQSFNDHEKTAFEEILEKEKCQWFISVPMQITPFSKKKKTNPKNVVCNLSFSFHKYKLYRG